jgi:hypothetical protein
VEGTLPAPCRSRPVASVSVAEPETPAADDAEARGARRLLLESVRPSRGPHLIWPSLRCGATTHVEGKAIRSSRRARRGAGCWLRATIGVSGRTPMSSSRIAWRRASAARRCLTGAHARLDAAVGEGFARAHHDDHETFDGGRRLALVFARGCGRRRAPGRAAAQRSAAGGSPCAPAARPRRASMPGSAALARTREGGRAAGARDDRRMPELHGQGKRIVAAALHRRALSALASGHRGSPGFETADPRTRPTLGHGAAP